MFYDEISNIHPSLKFTFEEETDGSLPFVCGERVTRYKCLFTANQHSLVSTSLGVLSAQNHKS